MQAKVLECGCKVKRAPGGSIDILLCPAHAAQLAIGRDVCLGQESEPTEEEVYDHQPTD